LAEQVLAEARIATRLYGIDQTVVILSGNAGFGGGANAAAGLAQTNRILVMSPDVFPRDADWAEKHTRLLEECPNERTRLFGAPLFFDDGSLAGAGLYYDIDKGPIRRSGEIGEFYLARVEHLGRGAPPDAVRFLTPRPVPGIAGAFMSCDRSWFERLGGFNDAYVQGDYEDADLCLRSIEAGVPPWIQDLKFWHLEPQGTCRSPVYEGGSIVNRWLFSANWGELISETLGGQVPKHPALCPENRPLTDRPDAVRGLTSDPRGDITDMVA
jgi:GT2 family glycosyltransferase